MKTLLVNKSVVVRQLQCHFGIISVILLHNIMIRLQQYIHIMNGPILSTFIETISSNLTLKFFLVYKFCHNVPTIICFVFFFIILPNRTLKSCYVCAIGISGALHTSYKNNIIESVHRMYLTYYIFDDSRTNHVFIKNNVLIFVLLSYSNRVLLINHKRVYFYHNQPLYFKLNCFY